MITIIPAIDIIDGKCVRLTRGEFERKKIYSDNPLELAKSYEAAGVKRLHLVDLDGARQKKVVNLAVLESIAKSTALQIDFGGGVQSADDIQMVFDAGAKQITAGSIAVRHPQTVLKWIAKYGSEKIILGADVKSGKIAINAWQETADDDIQSFLNFYRDSGIKTVICTDVSKDGLLQGPAFDLYQFIKAEFPEIQLIASGGIGTIDDISRLNSMKIDGVILGKALLEGQIQLEELKAFLC